MAKRKKHPKLPNGFGSIKYLGKNRRNPYAVHPPTEGFTLEGVPITPKALCYVDDWLKGFSVLAAWKTGTYTPGMEKDMELTSSAANNLEQLAEKLLADYNRTMHADTAKPAQKTFSEVYEEFYRYKYERENGREYSKQSRDSTKAAFKNCSILHNHNFEDLRHADLQAVVDQCPLKYASLELIVSLFKQMYRYAIVHDIVDKDYSAAVRIDRPDEEEHGEPFTDDDLEILWKSKEDEIVEMILIMCYSGYRIVAYSDLEVNLKEKHFNGGVKNKYSKNRTVPIHSGILQLVKRRMKRDGGLLTIATGSFRSQMYKKLESLEIERHTPHDCRHTFSKLCEDYKVNENDRKRMLGHSFGDDITNRVYGHRDLDTLRMEIEKIKICY